MYQRKLWLTCALAGTILGGGLTVAAQQGAASGETKPRVTEQEMMVWSTGDVATAFGTDTFAFVSGQGGMMSGKTVKGAPYSAEGVTESTQTLADGNRIVKRNSTLLYRDSEGRTRRETSLNALGPWASQEEPARMITIFDPVSGVTYTLNPRDRTVTKFSFVTSTGGGGIVNISGISSSSGSNTLQVFPAREGQVFSGTRVAGAVIESRIITGDGIATTSPANSNRPKIEHRREDLGTQTVEGVNAKGTRHTTIYPAGFLGNERPLEVVDEKWYSEELQTTVLTKHTDPRSGESTYRLTNINRSNPDRSLFEPPSDYKVLEPKVRATSFPRKPAAPAPPPAAPKPPQQ